MRPRAEFDEGSSRVTTESAFLPEHFERVDETPDSEFYSAPRFVVHIDDQAIDAAGRAYASLLPRDGEILDLMSAWRSHLPDDFLVARLVGLGMNAEEMAENPRLDEYVVHDLNADPVLPFEAGRFDGAIDTVSVQYLTRPVEVFAEVYRVLRPGGRFIVTYSNRCFPTKAVRIWTALGDKGHAQLVGAYFHRSAPWVDLAAYECNPSRTNGDPLSAVHARKPISEESSQCGVG
jgi:SAM-dependent methyltransferase